MFTTHLFFFFVSRWELTRYLLPDSVMKQKSETFRTSFHALENKTFFQSSILQMVRKWLNVICTTQMSTYYKQNTLVFQGSGKDTWLCLRIMWGNVLKIRTWDSTTRFWFLIISYGLRDPLPSNTFISTRILLQSVPQAATLVWQK